MTKVRIGAKLAKHAQDVIDWLNDNVGPFKRKEVIGITGIVYLGENWTAHWKPYGSGWFIDITFTDPKHATFFTLRWK